MMRYLAVEMKKINLYNLIRTQSLISRHVPVLRSRKFERRFTDKSFDICLMCGLVHLGTEC